MILKPGMDTKPKTKNSPLPTLPPCPWEKMYDATSGNYYYLNTESDQTQWEKPDCFRGKWIEVFDKPEDVRLNFCAHK